jgi:hypothetical protein
VSNGGTTSTSNGGTINTGGQQGGADNRNEGGQHASSTVDASGGEDTRCTATRRFDLIPDLVEYFAEPDEDTAWRPASAKRAPNGSDMGFIWNLDYRGWSQSGSDICPECVGAYIWTSADGNPGPVFGLNSSNTEMNILLVDTPAHGAFAHPGANCAYATMVWTAPCAGNAEMGVSYTGLADTSTDVHVQVRNDLAFSSTVQGYNDIGFYKGSWLVSQGDSIAFMVGCGTNNNYVSDATAIDVTITLMPL